MPGRGGLLRKNICRQRCVTNCDAEQIDTTRQPLTALSADDLDAADLVIVFDPLPFNVPERKLLDWSDVPSMNSSYDAARLVLDRRIDALLDRLQQKR